MGQGEDISGGGAAGGQMELQAQAGGGFFPLYGKNQISKSINSESPLQIFLNWSIPSSTACPGCLLFAASAILLLPTQLLRSYHLPLQCADW